VGVVNRFRPASALSLGLLVLFGLLGPGARIDAQERPPAEAPPAWDPKHTWVFAVGLCEWKNHEFFEPAPQKDRRDPQLVAALKARGVPDAQVTYLQDAQATKSHVAREFEDLLRKSRKGDFLIFYYDGHGYWNAKTGEHYFGLYDSGAADNTGWSMTSIFDAIEQNFQGSSALLTADCCLSGGMAVEARKRQKGPVAYACLTSAFTHNASSGAWTYTDCLLKGFRGDPVVDLNGDGVVTMHELALYTELEMAFLEEQKSVFETTGTFNAQMKLEKASGKHDPEIGRHVEAQSNVNAGWYKAEIVERNGDKVKAHYLDDDTREWITEKMTREFQPKNFAVGTEIQVCSEDDEDKKKKKWYPAKVVKAWYGLHLIHYDQKDSAWDEWVSPGRIKKR
jgi:hypothetical protein